MYYQIINTGKEKIGLVWQLVKTSPKVERIFLPCRSGELSEKIEKEYYEVNIVARSIPSDVAGRIIKMYAGEESSFSLSGLNLSKLTNFSAKVLRHACKIPRGKVTTYSGIAAALGTPHAVRAVGTVLANNPFPIIIPCHRVVRADGSLGGFGGGIKMKKELLAKEGVVLDKKERVPLKYFWR
jgi:methylated-DNA-[protein]-cysteine S-methyltransferase